MGTEKGEKMNRSEAISILSTRKTGKWIDLNATDRYKRVKVYDHFECSVCHERSSSDSKYCPNCGSYNGGDEE